MRTKRKLAAVWRRAVPSVLCMVWMMGTFGSDVHAQPMSSKGEYQKYEAVTTTGTMPLGYDTVLDPPWTYRNHPLHELALHVRPGVQLDAHSRGLLRIEPSAHLVFQVRDSLYLSRPGTALIHLVVGGKIRRTNVIPDTLFRIPEDRYVYGLQVTRDLLLGRLSAYSKRSSRVVGVFPFSIGGSRKVVVVLSHDYLNARQGSSTYTPAVLEGPFSESMRLLDVSIQPSVTLAIFSKGLVFEDLIRLNLAKEGVVDVLPARYGISSMTWETGFDRLVRVNINPVEGEALEHSMPQTLR